MLDVASMAMASIHGVRLKVAGVVQGVGFRPYVFRLAKELGIKGWVRNSATGVDIRAEGALGQLEQFRDRLIADRPPAALIERVEVLPEPAVGYREFEIRASNSGEKHAGISPDIATCSQCLSELFDPSNHRYRYPFINCSHCGPRFSILNGLPYDRARTTMQSFIMCARCQAEYGDPTNRRFHAQPNACADCGPSLSLWTNKGDVIAERDAALMAAVAALQRGQIVAVKGVGGFHLCVDAGNDDAVSELRRRKHRPAKPLALMMPNLLAVEVHCEVTSEESVLLQSAAAPIVLLRRKANVRGVVSDAIAPGNPYFGVMLSYAPLHHLLMAAFAAPMVATSGNLSDEPICIDEHEALLRLGAVVDLFLVHNRPIVRPLDDSVVCTVAGREMVLRCGRGYAPLQLSSNRPLSPILAVGGHMKNSFAIASRSTIFLSQHFGDLDSSLARQNAEQEIMRMSELRQPFPGQAACDLHPDYGSTHHARRLQLPLSMVPHHYAHVLACMAEHQIDGPLLGVAWDGSGLGVDGTLWGGEFLTVEQERIQRVAHLRPFRLPGGDRAACEPRRSLLGVFYELFGADACNRIDAVVPGLFSDVERVNLNRMLSCAINAPLTSGIGRLFDAVACLLGLGAKSTFEGEAAMALEFAVDAECQVGHYEIPLISRSGATPPQLDWEPMIHAMRSDLLEALPASVIAAKFHHGLVESIVQVARSLAYRTVVLSGGCFQNRYLLTRAVARLRTNGVAPYWPQRVPINDGGLAVGQVLGAALLEDNGLCA